MIQARLLLLAGGLFYVLVRLVEIFGIDRIVISIRVRKYYFIFRGTPT